MGYKFYGRCSTDVKSFHAYPGQIDSNIFSFNVVNKKIKLPEHLTEQILTATGGDATTIGLLVETNDDINLVTNLVEILLDPTVDTDKINSVKHQNSKYYRETKNLSSNLKKFSSIPENVFIQEKTWEFILSSLELGLYPMFLGPKGLGKTTLARELAKLLGYQFHKVNCGTLFKPKAAMVGQMQAKEGSTYLVESKFLTYFQSTEKVIIFLDEISRIPKQASDYLMHILDADEASIYIEETATTIFKGENVIFIAAGNFGPEYVDTRILDGALDDRFVKFYLDFLDEDEELKLVRKKLVEHKIKKDVTDINILKIIRKANQVREGVKDKELLTNVSTRKVIQLCYYLLHDFTANEIIEKIMRSLFIHDETELEYFEKTSDAI